MHLILTAKRRAALIPGGGLEAQRRSDAPQWCQHVTNAACAARTRGGPQACHAMACTARAAGARELAQRKQSGCMQAKAVELARGHTCPVRKGRCRRRAAVRPAQRTPKPPHFFCSDRRPPVGRPLRFTEKLRQRRGGTGGRESSDEKERQHSQRVCLRFTEKLQQRRGQTRNRRLETVEKRVTRRQGMVVRS